MEIILTPVNTISFPPSAAAWLACSTIEEMCIRDRDRLAHLYLVLVIVVYGLSVNLSVREAVATALLPLYFLRVVSPASGHDKIQDKIQ